MKFRDISFTLRRTSYPVVLHTSVYRQSCPDFLEMLARVPTWVARSCVVGAIWRIRLNDPTTSIRNHLPFRNYCEISLQSGGWLPMKQMNGSVHYQKMTKPTTVLHYYSTDPHQICWGRLSSNHWLILWFKYSFGCPIIVFDFSTAEWLATNWKI